jgi:hypothetical protein
MDDRGFGVRIPIESRNFCFLRRPDRISGPPFLPIQWVPGPLSPGVKRQGREADRSLPTSPEIKKMWIYTATLPYVFIA